MRTPGARAAKRLVGLMADAGAIFCINSYVKIKSRVSRKMVLALEKDVANCKRMKEKLREGSLEV